MSEVCGNCVGRSDWDFLREFYQRETINKQQVQSLSHYNSLLHKALHHAGLNSQKDRIALNKSHEQLQELQVGFSQSEISRAQIENALNEERQDHRMCQESLSQEQVRHNETRKHLDCIWSSHTRLGEIVSHIHCNIDGEKKDDYAEYNITSLIFELEAKASKLSMLESDLSQERMKARVQIEKLESQLESSSRVHADELAGAELRKSELEFQLRREQLTPKANADLTKEIPKRKWRHGRRRANAMHEGQAHTQLQQALSRTSLKQDASSEASVLVKAEEEL